MATMLKLMVAVLAIVAVVGVYLWNQEPVRDRINAMFYAMAGKSAEEPAPAAVPASTGDTLPIRGDASAIEYLPLEYEAVSQGWRMIHVDQLVSYPFTANGTNKFKFQLKGEDTQLFDFYLMKESEYDAAAQTVHGYTRLKADAMGSPLVDRTGQNRLEVMELTVPKGKWVAVVVNSAANAPASTIRVYTKYSMSLPPRPVPRPTTTQTAHTDKSAGSDRSPSRRGNESSAVYRDENGVVHLRNNGELGITSVTPTVPETPSPRKEHDDPDWHNAADPIRPSRGLTPVTVDLDAAREAARKRAAGTDGPTRQTKTPGFAELSTPGLDSYEQFGRPDVLSAEEKAKRDAPYNERNKEDPIGSRRIVKPAKPILPPINFP